MENLHLNVLILIGLALFLGTAGGDILKRLKIPGIVGFILAGVLIGPGFKIVDARAVEALRPFTYFALALIGFTIGGELRKDVFKKYGKALVRILTLEGLGAFFSVFALTAICGILIIGDIRTALALALLLGAVGSASDPASPMNIITESKSRGPLTTNIFGIVALDDGFAVLLFAVASSIAGRIIGAQDQSHHPALMPLYEIFGAVFLGIAAGLILVALLDRLKGREGAAGLSLGLITLTAGISVALELNMILSVMTFGFTAVNLRPEKSKEIFRIVRSATGPIFVLFFVIVGASIDFAYLGAGIFFLALAYMAGTAGGKIWGARLGAKLSQSPPAVYHYLPYCLFAQAGVAVGLTILASKSFPGETGTLMVAVITPSVFILQLMAPFATRRALEKAGETGLNITEHDLLENVSVTELFEKSPPPVHEDTPITEVLSLFSSGDNLYYPVVSSDNKLLGIVSVEGIKSALMEQELGGILLALDLMEPAPAAIRENVSLAEAGAAMKEYGIEFIPVEDEEGTLKGFIEERMLRKYISSRLFDMRTRISKLEKSRAGK